MGAQVAFWLLAPVMVLGALGMILSRKPVHSALCLAAVMISLAVQYAALNAPFLFAVQIIVYTGAILMLFLFVLMLVGVDAADNQAYGGNVQGLANLIFTKYVVAFEATSALLITAAVGAMVLAHRERLTKRKTQGDLVTERMKRYAETGQHPGPLPTPGVYARHNAVDTPALLPDGSLSELSVSATLRNRSGQADRRDLVRPIQRTIAELQADGELPQVTKPGAALTRRADLVPTEDRTHRGERPGPGAEPDGGTE